MPVLALSGTTGAINDQSISQNAFRTQAGAIADSLRQLVGDTDNISNFLVSTTTLYVNPAIGRDTFVSGTINGRPAQQYYCGYSPFAPFRTLARACAEAARLSISAGANNDIYDRVVIHCSAGEHIIYNGLGGAVISWGAAKTNPTDSELQQLNSNLKYGLIIPRGVSIIGEDLRKTVIRPQYVPDPTGDPVNARAGTFRITGGGFFFNFTFKDSVGATASHHLLHCFEFVNATELQAYYDRIETVFGTGDASEIRPGETEIVGPFPDGTPTSASDTTVGASAYIFNCSLRSDYGMCGMYLDGNEVTGLKSVVTAQFTNVTLQKDPRAWQIYNGSTWDVAANYAAYISADINNVRSRVGGAKSSVTGTYAEDWRSFSFKAFNNAVIQEVSCFVIGAGVHHWTASGGECTITNSNSNFGVTAFISDGFRGIGTTSGSLPQDRGFACVAIKRPLAIKQDGSTLRKIYLGSILGYSGGIITLNAGFSTEILKGYTLKDGDYIWVENTDLTTGPGYVPGDIPASSAIPGRAQLDGTTTGTPWSADLPNQIRVKVNGNNNLNTFIGSTIVGKKIYIRRIVDTRTPTQREYALILSNSNLTASRRPVGNYVLRIGGASNMSQQLDPVNGANEIYVVTSGEKTTVPSPVGSTNYYKLIIRSGDSAGAYNTNNIYRASDVIYANNRVRRCRKDQTTGTYDNTVWEASNPMLPSASGIEAPRRNVAPVIIIDKDTDPDPNSLTLGINMNTDSTVVKQISSTTDFKAIADLMSKIGYTDAYIGRNQASLASTALQPQTTEAARFWDPAASGSPTPNGKLTFKGAWPLEFNRPSLIRGYGHAYEWVGYGNYTKAIPKYQVTALSDQHTIDVLAVNLSGGRVYNTGFTEEGLLVQGDTIKDLGTNRDLTTETIGIGGQDGEISTSVQLSELTVNDLTASNVNISSLLDLGSANITGTPNWDTNVLPRASTSLAGVIQLATPQQVSQFASDNTAVTPATLIGALGSAVKSVVNCRLSLSPALNVPSADQSTTSNLYLHPYNGNEVALYNNTLQRWTVYTFSGVISFSLTPASSANTNYDIYFYTDTNNNPQIEYVAWPGVRTPPTRASRDGILVRLGNPNRRFLGVVRTTTGGSSRIYLGGTISGGSSATFPYMGLANYYNTYDATLSYFFGSSWSFINSNWAVPPSSVYPTAPRVAWVQAGDTQVTAFLDIYNNIAPGQSSAGTTYIAPGFNSTIAPPADAFYGETNNIDNATAGSQWVRSVPSGYNELYYLYKNFGIVSLINEHTAHGMLVSVKV